jgi:hypothetical protein
LSAFDARSGAMFRLPRDVRKKQESKKPEKSGPPDL